MDRSNIRLRQLFITALALTIFAGGCSQREPTDNSVAAPSAASEVPAVVATSEAAPADPEMLSTVGLYDKAPLTQVAARQGRFAIENVDGTATLTLNGKATRYTPYGADQPAPVTANDGLSLVGVFELPQESVAWVVVAGGAACAGTHVLVGARSGFALPGQEIPGCDDRGTMRKTGEKITFEAGGSSGTYQDGLISVETKPAA